MSFKAILYSLKEGVISLKRNKMFTLASVGTMVACLFMLGIFLAILINFNNIVDSAESTVTISVYFANGTEAEQKSEIGKLIRANDKIESAEYVSATEAWEKFSTEYYGGDEDLLASFGDDNPLGDSDSFIVTLKSMKDQEEVTNFLKSITGVRTVDSPTSTMESLNKLNRIISISSISLIVILFLVSIFLISNTIVIAINVRQEEISIMRLIGASNGYIRGPFVVEGAIIGLVGAVIPLGILYGVYTLLVRLAEQDLSEMASWLTLMDTQSIFDILVPVCLLLGLGIGLIGSIGTVRKHLKA